MASLSSTLMSSRQTLSSASVLRRYVSQVATSSKSTAQQRPARHARAASSSSSSRSLSERVYTARKQFLYSHYDHLLDTSDLVLVFQPNNLTMAEWSQLRRAISAVPTPKSKSDPEAVYVPATLVSARTGLLSMLVRKRAEARPAVDFSPLLSGPIALLTCPSLSPGYLKGLLQAVNKAFAYRPPAPTASSVQVTPRLMLLGGIMEKNKLVSTQDILEIGKLPELDTLRAQLVGLLEMPARQTIGILNQAAGGSLVRTLQGLEGDLKTKAGESEASA
jgi:large subunit ribosomal protein L10